jgi:hypothetical protein
MIFSDLWGILNTPSFDWESGFPLRNFLNLMVKLYEPDTCMASWTYTKQ